MKKKPERSLTEGVRKAFNTKKNSSPAPRRQVLGRGLGALMSMTAVKVKPDPFDIDFEEQTPHLVTQPPVAVLAQPSATAARNDDAPSESPAPIRRDGLLYLSVDEVVANKKQPRQNFNEADLERLSQSIRETGLLQPIVVRAKRDGEVPYEIVAGERRFRAAVRAGLKKIPAVYRELSDVEALELGIIENVQRADLNPVEEARAYQRLVEEFGQTQQEVAETVGKDRVSIANALRLLRLTSEVQELLVQGKVSAGHGRALLMLEEPGAQINLAKRILMEGLSVRAAEQIASGVSTEKAIKQKVEKLQAPKSPQVLELEERFRRALGTKVSLELAEDTGQGQLRINFFSRDELQALLDRVGA